MPLFRATHSARNFPIMPSMHALPLAWSFFGFLVSVHSLRIHEGPVSCPEPSRDFPWIIHQVLLIFPSHPLLPPSMSEPPLSLAWMMGTVSFHISILSV